ncbi:uncharacterized protein [Linepithema humile]|uniref:uncharacterized protein n=1 Tax=Linepithema humile TaxID=83485 RepID=UPI00351DE2A2
MKSFLILEILLLAIAATSIVQARKAEHTCGSLGSGVNACKCGEVVVKAAKVQKPLLYASPEAINEAAKARAGLSRYNVYQGCGAGKSSSSSSSSNTGYKSISSSSSSSASAISSIGIQGGLSSGSSRLQSPLYSVSGRQTVSDSGCGCGKKSGSLAVHDLLSSDTHGAVVPNFPPIGDLCYPNSPSSSYQMTTKVTPAYPGKIKCSPAIPYEVCIQILNGQIDAEGLRKLNLATANGASFTGGHGLLSSASASGASSNFGVSNVGSTVFGRSDSSSNLGRYTSNVGGFAAYGKPYAGSYAGTRTGLDFGINGLNGYKTYGNSFGTTSSSLDAFQNSAASQRYGCESADLELAQDYSYPRLPADPVSLSLAYKNLFPRTVLYNKRSFVPEDKLAFGHRTVPIESAPSKRVPDVPEEKLQILDKPVVELQPVLSTPISLGCYDDEKEEAKLAELEAIERERINRQEIVEQTQGNFITYGDLGYAPINTSPGKYRTLPVVQPTVNVVGAEEDGVSCGPVGPPVPGYVPGGIMIDQEIVVPEGGEIDDDIQRDTEQVHFLGGASDEDDIDDSTSGIFARLKSTARKYGSACGIP